MVAEAKGKHSRRSVSVCQNSYFKFLQGSAATLFRWSWKCYRTLWL